MASDVGGTARFSGIVAGFAALGAVLFGRVSAGLSAYDDKDTLATALECGARKLMTQSADFC